MKITFERWISEEHLNEMKKDGYFDKGNNEADPDYIISEMYLYSSKKEAQEDDPNCTCDGCGTKQNIKVVKVTVTIDITEEK